MWPLTSPLRLLKRQFPFSLSSTSPPAPSTSDAPSQRGRGGFSPAGKRARRTRRAPTTAPPHSGGSGRGTPAAPSRAAYTRTHTLLAAPPCSGRRRRQPSLGSRGWGSPAESSAPTLCGVPSPAGSCQLRRGSSGLLEGRQRAGRTQAGATNGLTPSAWRRLRLKVTGRRGAGRGGQRASQPCSEDGGLEQRRTEGSLPRRLGPGSKPRPSFFLACRHAPLALTDLGHSRRRRL